MIIDNKKSEARSFTITLRKNIVTQTTPNMIFLLQLVGYVRYLVFTKRITTYRRSIQLVQVFPTSRKKQQHRM